eukprot:452523-Pyramimonas_sp.AAC.1
MGGADACKPWALGGAPDGAMKHVRGVSTWVARTHANPATGAVGGAPRGATKRARGVPKWVGRMH